VLFVRPNPHPSPQLSDNGGPPRASIIFRAKRAKVYELFQSPSELPSATWWLERQELAGIYAKLHAWTRLANAVRIVQARFDETKINGNASCLPYLFCHLYLKYFLRTSQRYPAHEFVGAY
jgi:hypothetical protein